MLTFSISKITDSTIKKPYEVEEGRAEEEGPQKYRFNRKR